MNIITSLLLLLAGSKLFGRIAQSFGYSVIIGEVLAGLVLGPTLLEVVTPSKELNGIIELGIFLMIFSAGLEMNLQDIFSAIRKKALFCSILGVSFSFIAGFTIGYVWNFSTLASFVMSLCFSITALPVVIRFMNTFHIIDTKLGHTVMGSAVILDVIALLFLGITLNIDSIDNSLDLLKIISTKSVGMILFFGVVMLVNQFLRSEILKASRTQNKITQLINYLDEEAIFGVGMIFVLLFSTATEALGFHFIIGAFFGGLLLNKDILGMSAFNSMSKTLNAVTGQFLTPIFFAFIGLRLSIDAFDQPLVLLSIVSVAYLSKIFGSWLGAKWAGFSSKEAGQIGIALNCKGILDLIVADIAFEKGYIDSFIFSVLIFIGLSSLIINPMIYRQWVKNDQGPQPT